MENFIMTLATQVVIAFGVVVAMVVIAYCLAFVDIFFGRVEENTGFSIVAGDRLLEMKAVSRSKHLEKKTIQLGGESTETWVVVDGEDPNPTTGLRGWLERHMGIYWTGWWPFQGRHRYEMFRTVFDRSPDAGENDVLRRQNDSNFFYIQPVEYAFSLLGAETGSALLESDEGGGNIPVDVKFSVFILIVYPEIAIFKNPVWFERARSIIIGHAKNYVGTRAFDMLRSEKDVAPSDTVSDNSFSGYMSLLNEKIPGSNAKTGTERGLPSELGVKIVGAAIRTIDIVGDLKGSILASTTELYRKGQEAAGIRKVADARQYELTAELEAIDSSPNGRFARRQRALERASEKGQLIVFTGENDDREQRLTANLLPGVQEKKVVEKKNEN